MMENSNESDGAPLTHSLENVSRRSRKVKNLEKEVEMILSQDESDEERENDEELAPLPKTPSTRRRQVKGTACTPQASESVLQDMLQTPRRSCRKSIKPPQDYDDIVKHSTRRSARKKLKPLDENNEENENEIEEEYPKWSAASVGRSSTKRGRKSRRNTTTNRGRRNLNETALDEQNVAHVSSRGSEETDDATVHVKKEVDVEISIVPDNVMENNENVMEVKGVKEEGNQLFKEVIPNPEVHEEIPLEQKEIEDVIFPKMEEKNPEEINCVIDKIPQEQPEHTMNLMQEDENPEEDIQLIQDDEEDDVKEVIIQQQQEEEEKKTINDVPYLKVEEVADLSVQEESMISIKDDSIIEQVKNENEEYKERKSSVENDSFGCYLKSKEIDIDDLGLNPINDDDDSANVSIREEVKMEETQNVALIEQPEEMPSLILCDDDDDCEDNNEKPQEEETVNLNETFDAGITEDVTKTSNVEGHLMEVDNLAKGSDLPLSIETTEMDKLQLSDDEEEEENGPAKKKSKVMFSNQIPSSPSTPKQSKMTVRQLTPYRTKSDSKPKIVPMHGSDKKLHLKKDNLNFSTSELTTMTPRDIVLRGIRKRSMSVCLGVPVPKLTRSAKKAQQKAVNFYSPANQTAIIEDLDKLIQKNVKQNMQKSEDGNKNVTTRRKRSYSFDESTMSKSMCVTSRLPRPMANSKHFLNSTTTSSSTLLTSSMSKPARTKLPNFAAIHQKQFQKMENLADHVARKQERSKNLINSNSKIRPVSAQKNISTSVRNNSNTNEKPKALKRIDMTSSQSQIQGKSANTSIATTARKLPAPLNNQNKNPIEQNTKSSNLPDPRDAKIPLTTTKSKTTVAPSSMLPKKHLQPTQSFNVSSNTNYSFKQKPTFNLSTQVAAGSSSTASSRLAANTSIAQKKTTTTGLTNQDKMASRLQRHMDMFKGRVPAARAGVASRKNEAAIKGVRSNRRFELQMQHRKNIEN
ncbi:probable serine/threonine-protein kinase kinX isoform X1 [Musca domestica]|uniref:Probable serine/threonine-protein kinase kinX isoform X1 n=1 Tax=Musca domestica TaxID=7370 RepID=A0A9J7D262_MUSDO|nr:probable serine/threonine-protein kinase kinX isoform X1 [Musca domestica]